MQANLSIDDAVYREAIAAAAQEGVTLQEFVEESLRIKLGHTPIKTGEAVSGDSTQPAIGEKMSHKREPLAQFFAELNAKPRKDGPSVGPLNREELYQRGVRGY